MVSGETGLSGRLSQVNGWGRIAQLFGQTALPWGESSRVSALQEYASDLSSIDSYSIQWGESSGDDESYLPYDDDESYAADGSSIDSMQSFGQDTIYSTQTDKPTTFIQSFRMVANSPSNSHITLSTDKLNDSSLSDEHSTSGFSYASKPSMHSVISHHGRAMMTSMESAEKPKGVEAEETVPHPKTTFAEFLDGTKYTKHTLSDDYWDKFFLPITFERSDQFNSCAARLVAKGDREALQSMHDSSGIALDACNDRGETLLHLACRAKSRSVVHYLLEQGASLRVRDKVGRSPLVELCLTNKPDFSLVSLLLNKVPALLFAVDRQGFSPLHYVPNYSHKEWNALLMNVSLKPKLLTFARFAAFSQAARELHNNQERLQKLLLERLSTESC